MIITVTLNPAVDKTIVLGNLKLGKVNRASRVHEDAGGKGLNVSKMLRNLEEESLATGVIAGNSGLFIRNQLNCLGIKHDFVEIEGNTRTNIKLVDITNRMYTDINEPGVEIPRTALEQVEEKIFSHLKAGDVLVLSGSVPQNVDKGIYGKWVCMAKEKGAYTLLDADSELLIRGINAAPYLIKPNIHELEDFLCKKIGNADEVVEAARKLLGYGIKIVVVSMGEQGSIFITNEKVLTAKAPKVEVKSTVGAGDSMVGALAYAVRNGLNLEESARLAAAAATASVSNEGTVMGTLKQTEFWKSKIEVAEYGMHT